MEPESREEKIADIMTEVANKLLADGPLTLESMVAPYEEGEMGPFLIAFSRLEADGMVVKDTDGKWRWNGPALAEKDFEISAPLKVRLYRETDVKNLDLNEVSDYLKRMDFVGEVSVVENFGGAWTEDISEKLEGCRVRDITKPSYESDTEDLPSEWESLDDEGMTGVLYDGTCLRSAYLDLIPEEERDEDFLHLIFTDRFFGTWKPATQRYHARISVYGFPSVVSTTGIVDAPARPRGMYKIEREGDGLKITRRENEKFLGDYSDYDDERLTEIMKGYALQALSYHLSSWPFCENNECRLYNPHAQTNLLRAQLFESEFCDEHREIF